MNAVALLAFVRRVPWLAIASFLNGVCLVLFAYGALHFRTTRAIASGLVSAAMCASSATLWIVDRRVRDRALDHAVRELLERKGRP